MTEPLYRDVLGYTFSNTDLLREALTHPSAGEPFNNERLEFLGDAVLDLAVAEYLYSSHEGLSEGQMTLAKSAVVSRSALSKIAERLNIGEMVIAGPGLGDRAAWPESVMGNALEAIVGAVYLDGGMDAARDFVTNTISEHIRNIMKEGAGKDYKSVLLEMTQAGDGDPPVYEVVKEEGSPHNRLFTVSVCAGAFSGQGSGRTKKEAEQNAAESLLRKASLI